MLGGRARAASMTAEERIAWACYMLAHQPRFWDGQTLARNRFVRMLRGRSCEGSEYRNPHDYPRVFWHPC